MPESSRSPGKEPIWVDDGVERRARTLSDQMENVQVLDTERRLCIFGFCRSIEILSDVVEDTVLEHRGKPELHSATLERETTINELKAVVATTQVLLEAAQ
ncbi:uncharacterized protein A4U43_C02F17490 [Asparagus officinalis]|uniref:DUF7811 domain-containing protein n=1 Tax=Asparagus officinalis TaxID=4686 RepID=A0A5P1FLP9_ASPOF|nr:uncharacterized protein A4U43_C02F17490 [Asparagus officinalis]